MTVEDMSSRAARPVRRPRPDGYFGASLALVLGMVGAITVVAIVVYWDASRESVAALDDFAEEQATLAGAAASALRARLDQTREAALAAAHEFDARGGVSPVRKASNPLPVVAASATSVLTHDPDTGAAFTTQIPLDRDRVVEVPLRTSELVLGLTETEKPGARMLLIRRPGRHGLVATDGRIVISPRIASALDAGSSSLRLSRAEAADLGLPARTAMVGVREVDAGVLGKWGVATVATAERERDREVRAEWRFVLGVILASGLVLAFGGVAVSKQRKELELARELVVAEAQKHRDERLVRADKLATMGALATGIAHEVSTPLGVIMGRAEQLLPKVQSDERARRALDAIIVQTERINGIIRGFLSLARGDEPQLERARPGELARVAVDLVEHRFVNAGVALTTDIAPGLPTVSCEPRLFEQVIVNLLLNACDACDPGGQVKLRVRADADRVAFVVTDDGSGIPADAAARVLEPFFTTKPAGKGSGLGLAIANEIVKHHNGSLSVESRNDASSRDSSNPSSTARGTRACIQLPALQEST
jgi:two-component system NtrC family sensor kinase